MFECDLHYTHNLSTQIHTHKTLTYQSAKAMPNGGSGSTRWVVSPFQVGPVHFNSLFLMY